MGITAATYVAAAVTLLFAVIPMVTARQQTAMATQASVGMDSASGAEEATGTEQTVGIKKAPATGWHRLLAETGDGLRYLWTGQKMLFFMLLSFALVNFALVPLGPLAPFLAEQRLGLDAQGLGLLMAGLPVGTLLGAGIISVLGSRFHRGKGVIWGVTILGLAQAGYWRCAVRLPRRPVPSP